MEARIQNGDYLPDGLGGIIRCRGADALVERVLFRLTAHRGGLPPLPGLGSRLYLLSREPATQRLSAARQYVMEALAEEMVTVADVSITPERTPGRVRVTVLLDYNGTALSVSTTV